MSTPETPQTTQSDLTEPAEPAEELPPGLDDAEAADRARQGLTNRAPTKTSRSLGAIVAANVFTRFNAILGVLLVVILTIGPFQDALFGIVMVVNTMIGIAQEWRAKRTLDRLSLLSAPRVTVVRSGRRVDLAMEDIVQDDVVELTPGAQVVADGEVVHADALEVDESLLTGESVPEAKDGGDQVLSGSFVTAGRGWYRAEKVGAEAYANKLATEARQFSLVRSDLRQGEDLILRMVTWIIIPTAALLVWSQMRSDEPWDDAVRGSVAGIGSMIPEGLVLLTSIAFAASVIRLGQRNVLVQELAAIEGLARVDVVCIDKTGTITEPVLEVVSVQTVRNGHVKDDAHEVGDAAGADDTKGEYENDGEGEIEADGNDAGDDGEGEADDEDRAEGDGTGSEVDEDASANGDLVVQVLGALAWADPEPNASMSALAARFASPDWTPTWRAAFSSARRFSGSGFGEHGDWVMGAPDVLLAAASDRSLADAVAPVVDQQSRQGRRVLLLSRVQAEPGDKAPANTPVAVVALEERIRADASDTLGYFGRQGITIKVLSGDDPRTVGAVAGRVGIGGADHPRDARELPEDPDELADVVEATGVFGRVAPHQKQDMVRALQARGHTVAMTGDGVNDVLALKESDLGVAMGSGSPASRAVAPVVLLDSSFASLPPVLSEGRKVIANVERVANLFITKTVYATVLALTVGVVGMSFPFLPRHLTIISSLTIGIPGFFLALAPNEQRYVPGFVWRVLRFAGPAGIVAATSTLIAYELAHDTSGVSNDEARTVATITLFLVALWVLAILARPASLWRTSLVAAMGVLFVGALSIPWFRDVFALDLPSRLMVLSAVGIAAMAGVAIELGWQASGWVRNLRANNHNNASTNART